MGRNAKTLGYLPEAGFQAKILGNIQTSQPRCGWRYGSVENHIRFYLFWLFSHYEYTSTL
jgi:hypothetical protein